MDTVAGGFDWDAHNAEKCEMHGVSLAEIEELFRHPLAVYPDPAHSRTEQRFIAIGQGEAGQHVLVVFTYRLHDGETLIRPISARYMHRKEVDYFAQEVAKTQHR